MRLAPAAYYLKGVPHSYQEADRVEGGAAFEGFGAEADESLKDAVAILAGLEAERGRKARATQAEAVEALAEDVAHAGLERAAQRQPDRPGVAHRRDRRAAVVEPTGA